MSDALFRLTNAIRRLSDKFRLQVDDLSVERGKVTALLGPTGAGKSTLLRLLTGLEHVDKGTVEFNGNTLDRGASLDVLREITMVPQRPILLNGSVEDNVAYGLCVRGVANGQVVSEMLIRLGLDRLARQDARSLSGGQVQLVALARALIFEPNVLLLDEPTANLDPGYVALVEKTITETQASREMTVVWATHNLFQAKRVSQQVVLILNGRVVESGDNLAFFDNPTDPRTAAFIDGKMVY